MSEYFGKYRGVVINNDDPVQIGRLQVQVPYVLGDATSDWALPCLPFSGPQAGFFVIPAIGASVWVEFEAGDVGYPIWCGGFWETAADLPPQASAAGAGTQQVILRTGGGATLMLTDLPGSSGVVLQSASGAMISVGDQGITLSNGQGATITLTGATVDINSGGLTVV